MLLWRISRHLDLQGTGGLRWPGRWHDLGHPIVYLATSPAAALLEVCVHTSANDIPSSYTLLKISAPDDVAMQVVGESQLPENWRSRIEATRDLGTRWLRANTSALLQVPSALAPETTNVLLNPLHEAAAQCRILASQSYPFDRRLKQ